MACTKVLKLMETTGDFQASRSSEKGNEKSLQNEWEFKHEFQLVTTYNGLGRRVNAKYGSESVGNQEGV